MSQPYKIPSPKVGWLDRVMPQSMSYAWLWRLRYTLFGQAKNINLNSEFIDLTGSDLTLLTNLLPTKADFVGSDGLRVWRVRKADLPGLNRCLNEKPERIIDSPRVTMGDKAVCALHSGPYAVINGTLQPVGVTVNFLPYVGKDATDLTAVLCFSESLTNLSIATGNFPYAGVASIQTNFYLAGRFQLSRETAGIFVLPPATISTNQKRIGLLLTSNVIQPQKATKKP